MGWGGVGTRRLRVGLLRELSGGLQPHTFVVAKDETLSNLPPTTYYLPIAMYEIIINQ